MKKDNSVAEDDNLRPEYDASESRGASVASTWIVTGPGQIWRCWSPTSVRHSRPMRPSTRHSVAHADPAPGLSPSDTLWARRLDFGEHDRTLQVERPSRWMKAARGVDSLTT